MQINMTISKDNTDLIVSTLANALRAAEKDADKYYDLNEQTKSNQNSQISLLTRIISRQSDEVITNLITGLRKELDELKAQPSSDNEEVVAIIDMVETMVDYSTEDASSLRFNEELCKILTEYRDITSTKNV